MKDVTIWVDFKALQHLASSNKNNRITQTSITYYPTLITMPKQLETHNIKYTIWVQIKMTDQ